MIKSDTLNNIFQIKVLNAMSKIPLPANCNKSTSWFLKPGYAQGVFWITLVALTSNMNDILMREASRLPAQEVTFFRYFFALITLLPIMLVKYKTAFKTERPGLHIIRSLLLFVAILSWAGAVKLVPLTVMSIYALTVPLFVLPMASLFLKERVGWQRTLATILGVIGIFVIMHGSVTDTDTLFQSLTLQSNTAPHVLTGIWMLLGAAIAFALSDIVNKKYVSKESNLSMLFYIALGTAIFASFFAYPVFVMPTMDELFYLVLLGAGGNLILFFLLKAFAATDVSSLAPYRYTELIFAGFFGYFLYAEIPTIWTFSGAGIIILSTALIAWYEIKVRKKN